MTAIFIQDIFKKDLSLNLLKLNNIKYYATGVGDVVRKVGSMLRSKRKGWL